MSTEGGGGNGLPRGETLTALARRVAYHEARLDRDVAGRRGVALDAPEEEPHALLPEEFALRIHGRERRVDEAPERDVVDPDHGKVLGHRDAERPARAEKADRDHVVVADDRVGAILAQHERGADALALGHHGRADLVALE